MGGSPERSRAPSVSGSLNGGLKGLLTTHQPILHHLKRTKAKMTRIPGLSGTFSLFPGSAFYERYTVV